MLCFFIRYVNISTFISTIKLPEEFHIEYTNTLSMHMKCLTPLNVQTDVFSDESARQMSAVELSREEVFPGVTVNRVVVSRDLFVWKLFLAASFDKFFFVTFSLWYCFVSRVLFECKINTLNPKHVPPQLYVGLGRRRELNSHETSEKTRSLSVFHCDALDTLKLRTKFPCYVSSQHRLCTCLSQ